MLNHIPGQLSAMSSAPRSRHRAALLLSLFMAILVVACGDSDASPNSSGEWKVEGPLLAWEGDTWVIDGVPVRVPSELGVDDRRWLGGIVTATGALDDSGRRVAERVTIVEGTTPNSTLPATAISGPVAGMEGNVWTVGDTRVVVPDGTRVTAANGVEGDQSGVPIGAPVEVEGFQLPDNRVLAASISLLASDVQSPANSGEPTAVETPEPADPAPPSDGNDDDSNAGNGNGGDDDTEKEKPGRPDNPGKPEKPGKPDDDDD